MARMNPGLKSGSTTRLTGDGSEMAVKLEVQLDRGFRAGQGRPAGRAAAQAAARPRNKLRDLMTKVDRSEELESLLEQVLQNSDELKALSA